jgi:hypothetical protein
MQGYSQIINPYEGKAGKPIFFCKAILRTAVGNGMSIYDWH